MSALDDMIYMNGSMAIAPKARAELTQLRATVAAQSAIIKEQEQDISNITAREAAVVENHRKSNAALEAAVNEARELLTTLEWNDWDESVDVWLAAHPAPVTPEKFEQVAPVDWREAQPDARMFDE